MYSRFYVGADRFGSLLDRPLAELDAANFKAILDREGGNQSAAARALGISRNKLARLLRGGD